jgi:ribosomal protein S18 acetylase RimI-like enzyme
MMVLPTLQLNHGLVPSTCIVDFGSFTPQRRSAIMGQVTKIERKSFPSNEAFDFDAELKKKNTRMILAVKEGTPEEIVGYLIYARTRRLVLLHKICVLGKERRKGVGKCLMHSLYLLVKKGGCDSIHLWVDEGRKSARALYDSFGFQQIDRCLDYYASGRTGLKMQLSIGE